MPNAWILYISKSINHNAIPVNIDYIRINHVETNRVQLHRFPIRRVQIHRFLQQVIGQVPLLHAGAGEHMPRAKHTSLEIIC